MKKKQVSMVKKTFNYDELYTMFVTDGCVFMNDNEEGLCVIFTKDQWFDVVNQWVEVQEQADEDGFVPQRVDIKIAGMLIKDEWFEETELDGTITADYMIKQLYVEFYEVEMIPTDSKPRNIFPKLDINFD